MATVSMIGLGAMGARMARRILDAGHTLTVYNRSAEPADGLVRAGARRADTPADAARAAQIVIVMVTDNDASRAVWTTPGSGVLAGLSEGQVAVEASTLTPAWVRDLGQRVRQTGAEFLDAPVVGTRPHAEQGILTVLAGGSAAALDRASEVFASYAARTVHVGDVGSGETMKLAVNTLFAAQVAAYSEISGFLAQAGIAAPEDKLAALPITSPALQRMLGLMSDRAFAPNFPIRLVAKDLRYAEAAAIDLGALPLSTAATREVYERAIREGYGDADVGGVRQMFD